MSKNVELVKLLKGAKHVLVDVPYIPLHFIFNGSWKDLVTGNETSVEGVAEEIHKALAFNNVTCHFDNNTIILPRRAPLTKRLT
jgi:hypothetical protein